MPTLPREATLQSWAIKYVSNASVLLYAHLASRPKDEDNYTRYTSIVQSSGMGKSRAVDELSKTHLVVPLMLHQESKGKFFASLLVQVLILKLGFPAMNENVHDWFL